MLGYSAESLDLFRNLTPISDMSALALSDDPRGADFPGRYAGQKPPCLVHPDVVFLNVELFDLRS